MNKFFIAAASALALASCSSDDFLGEIQGNEQNGATSAINFGGDTGKITRATTKGNAAADLLENNFVVVGFKGSKTDVANNETYAFDHYNVNFKDGSAFSTESNRAGWEYVNQDMKVKGADKSLAQSGASQQTIKYWDHSCASYDFIAFSMGKKDAASKYATPTHVDKANLATAAYTLTGDVNTLSECYISDMKTVKEKEYNKTPVSMSFRHLASKVRMALFEIVPGYVISDVKFYDATSTTATANPEGTLIGEFNNSGTLTVFFPTTGTDHATEKDYNKAHVRFTKSTTEGETAVLNFKKFGTVKYNNQAEGTISAGKTYLSQNAAEPSYCGAGYQNVLPSEGAASAITLRIDYKLTSVDGSKETINVKGATATVPAQYTEWKSGYAYTYIFKISQDTNGSTGGTSTGLTAISFDAVVVDDEANGLQETITTVSDNSFTTYGYKDNKVTTNGNEYVNGTDIYATVYVPAAGETAAKTVAPQKLYTVTLEDGATQTINEASVANALVKGTNDTAKKTWTVTDNLGKKMVVTETAANVATTVDSVPAGPGYTLKVNALKWTGVVTDSATETYYVVEYDNGTKKSYKIVKVVKN
jgi:lipoprotein